MKFLGNQLVLVTMAIMLNPLHAGPLIVAHRGASMDAPENTIPAFELAWEMGADAIEGDFRLTADGYIVCIHDKDTKKTTGIKKIISESTFAELAELDAGSWFDKRFSGTAIPLLEDVLQTVPEGKQVFIEVKCGPEIIPALLEELRSSDIHLSQVTVISFNADVIRGLKGELPDLKANLLVEMKTNMLGRMKPAKDLVLATLIDIKADGLGLRAHRSLDLDFIESIKEAGFACHVWTIDDVGKARHFADLGAESITTNEPDAIREGLATE